MKNPIIAIVGLGYVGLPLALAFGRTLSTIGFDVSEEKIHAYQKKTDPAKEFSLADFTKATHLQLTASPMALKEADFIIVAVPTPVDSAKQPDLTLVREATKIVAQNMKQGAVVIYESTVYPGVTEEVCVPLLEQYSGLLCGEGFKVGYSPERINPGDKKHTLETIVKVVAGQDLETVEKIAALYETIIPAGVYKASSIQVAEAAKVIENTQRDLNIALVNELAIIFKALNIDTSSVLEAASTKWNFLPFKPGLVGGHCIGVDPYYLTYKAEQMGYHPQVILAGRRINDGMGKFIAEQTVKQLIRHEQPVKGASCLVMGLAFKENCRDIRNTRVVDIIQELISYGVKSFVWDPVVEQAEAYRAYELELVDWRQHSFYSAVIAAVPHQEILRIDIEALAQKIKEGAPFIDVKSAFDRQRLEAVGFKVWRL
ncbi:MAG: nucleotide sugar dehydrogenase [Gammaproteobacteria bacterium]|nr:nucleotide sugar dehydrogenase [Gammaproteobacteria bacterium]